MASAMPSMPSMPGTPSMTPRLAVAFAKKFGASMVGGGGGGGDASKVPRSAACVEEARTIEQMSSPTTASTARNPYQLYQLCLSQMTWCPNQTEPVRLL